MHPVRLGTCGWSYQEWSGVFYPKGTKPGEYLSYLAQHYPVVEVDSSYYAMPSVDNSIRWVERTPADFVFNIKAFRLLTNHPTQSVMLPKDIQGLAGPAARGGIQLQDRECAGEVALFQRPVERPGGGPHVVDALRPRPRPRRRSEGRLRVVLSAAHDQHQRGEGCQVADDQHRDDPRPDRPTTP